MFLMVKHSNSAYNARTASLRHIAGTMIEQETSDYRAPPVAKRDASAAQGAQRFGVLAGITFSARRVGGAIGS